MNPLPNRPMVIAHRGASGHAVENSLEAFRKAAELGADGVELDVHATSDGRLVVFHDHELPGSRLIAGLPAEEVRRFRLANGEPVPFLEEVIEAIPSLALWIEVKGLAPDWDQQLLTCIDSAPVGQCAVHSFEHSIIRRLRQKRSGLRLGLLYDSHPADPAGALHAHGAETLWPRWPLVDHSLVTQVHEAGGRVIAWTVNDRETAARLAGLGVDGLCGNYPERLLSL